MMITLARSQILPHNPCESGLAAFDAAAPSGTLTGVVTDFLRQHPALCRFIGWAIARELIARDVLVGANLSGANLSGADLTDANLSGANLSGANLIHANLIHANLTDANLSGADLSGANLIHANLTDANLIHANLPKLGERIWTTEPDWFPRHSKDTKWPEGFVPLTKAWGAVE